MAARTVHHVAASEGRPAGAAGAVSGCSSAVSSSAATHGRTTRRSALATRNGHVDQQADQQQPPRPGRGPRPASRGTRRARGGGSGGRRGRGRAARAAARPAGGVRLLLGGLAAASHLAGRARARRRPRPRLPRPFMPPCNQLTWTHARLHRTAACPRRGGCWDHILCSCSGLACGRINWEPALVVYLCGFPFAARC